MASIKDIATLAQVSQGTASIVLGGKGDQYRISPATQKRILEAAKQLNYRPNISARRLRSGGETVLPIIALFWTLDTRTVLIGRFLNGLQRSLAEMEEEYELLIQPYVGTRLSEVHSLKTGTRFNGAIIANPTEEDEKFLEAADLQVPVVLYQRQSTKYSYVNVDSFKSGSEVAEKFAARRHKRAAVVVPNVSSSVVRLRVDGFLAKAAELGLEVKPAMYADFSAAGGYEAVHSLSLQGEEEWPTALFILSDQMAVGALAALDQLGKKVPEDVEVIGYDDDEAARYAIPALTTVHLPVEEMAGECLKMITALIRHKVDMPIGKTMETRLVIRKSCGS